MPDAHPQDARVKIVSKDDHRRYEEGVVDDEAERLVVDDTIRPIQEDKERGIHKRKHLDGRDYLPMRIQNVTY